MASAFYTAARTAFAEGRVLWRSSGGDIFRVMLIDTDDYTVDIATDEFLSDVPSAARVATVALTPLTPTDGVLDAANVTFPEVSGDECEALVIYQDTGSEATSRLVLYVDGASAGLPVTPTGTDIAVTWGDLANRIGKL